MTPKHFLNLRLFIQVVVAMLCHSALQAQHVHVNAGAKSIAQDAPLYFANGDTYTTNAGYDVYLAFSNSGPFSNLFQGAGMTFTSLASTPDNGGPAPGHAADGAFLQLQFLSLSGPADSDFTVWAQDEGDPTTSHPLLTLPAGMTNGTSLIPLSEGDGSAGMDPYGHIHGRTFTATKAGLYTLGCRIVDTSTNGQGGGPMHVPSAPYYFYFQAGLTISSSVPDDNQFDLQFGTATGKTYYVESTPNLATTNWTNLAGPFNGDNHLLTVSTNSTAPQSFFRLRSD